MKAHDDFGAYGGSARNATLNQDRRRFRGARAEPVREIENARGLVIAVAMSAACWAAIALAFVL